MDCPLRFAAAHRAQKFPPHGLMVDDLRDELLEYSPAEALI